MQQKAQEGAPVDGRQLLLLSGCSGAAEEDVAAQHRDTGAVLAKATRSQGSPRVSILTKHRSPAQREPGHSPSTRLSIDAGHRSQCLCYTEQTVTCKFLTMTTPRQ